MSGLKGKNIVFTGFRDSGLEGAIKEKGGVVTSGVSKKHTHILVVSKADDMGSQKAKRAMELGGVTVMLKDEFLAKYFKKRASVASSYLTHDNGGRPFRVTVTKTHFWVHRVDEENDQGYSTLVWKQTPYQKVFVGKGRRGVAAGNSVLIQVSTTGYMYIGEVIYAFKSTTPITAYHSPVGNSDVPYPWAVSQTHAFLMLERLCIPLALFKGDLGKCSPYDQYYEWFEGRRRKMVEKELSKYEMKIKLLHKRVW